MDGQIVRFHFLGIDNPFATGRIGIVNVSRIEKSNELIANFLFLVGLFVGQGAKVSSFVHAILTRTARNVLPFRALDTDETTGTIRVSVAVTLTFAQLDRRWLVGELDPYSKLFFVELA